jgi:hypothetical protein
MTDERVYQCDECGGTLTLRCHGKFVQEKCNKCRREIEYELPDEAFAEWEYPPHICRVSGKAHSPAIVSRCGGPTAEELNICGICGSDLTMVRGAWIAISDEQAYSIRMGRK